MSGGGALPLPRAAATAALAGTACMALELTAVRLLAPFFGDSAYVWTNVIGVILLALALGAFAGGRLAERPAGSPLPALLLTAGCAVAVTPLLGPPLGDWLLPQQLPLDAALPALVRGSFVATVLLFALPVLLLGAVTPGLVVASVRGGAAIGRAAGAISAAGTVGSLVGTFAATHWLVPQFGCRSTLWACALLLAGAALLCRGTRRGAIVAVVIAATVLLPQGPLRAALPGTELLAARETRYQFLRVVRTPQEDGPVRTELKINEGLDSYHSVALAGHVLVSNPAPGMPPASYYDFHALVPFLAGDGARPADLRALSIGDAAGTFRRIYHGVHPGSRVDAVELDPVAVELGDEFFAGERARGAIVTDVDGRVFVARSIDHWHAVHVDAYSHQVNIPAQLASREFFAAVQRRLLPGGVVACNVGGFDASDPVATAIGGTMAAVFGDAMALHVPGSRNLLLVARAGAALDAAVFARIDAGDTGLGEADRDVWRRVLDAARTGRWVHYPASTEPLADDRPVLDQLLYGSYLAERGDATPIAIVGTDAPEGAEVLAHAAYGRRDADAVLEAARRSRQATAYLRFLCGSARWLRRELRGAEAEYRTALTLEPGADLAAAIRGNLEALRGEFEPLEAAQAVAARNGWLAVLLGLLLAGLCAAAYRMSRMPAAPSVRVSTAAR